MYLISDKCNLNLKFNKGDLYIMTNKNLKNAKKEKNDEFYTQLSDIERELKRYKKHLKDKVVF